MVVRELGFEMKAQPSNRMKTEEELVREEEERLKKLEADRLRRMLGKDEDENAKKPKHVSADDLSDGFILDKDDRRLLSYKVRHSPFFAFCLKRTHFPVFPLGGSSQMKIVFLKVSAVLWVFMAYQTLRLWSRQ